MTDDYYGIGESPHSSQIIQDRRHNWVRAHLDPDGLLPHDISDAALKAILREMGEDDDLLPWEEEE